MIFVYNARGTAVSGSPIRVAVGQKSGSYAVLDSFGRTIPAQLLPVTSADVALREDYYGFPKPAIPLSWLAWQADLPPAGECCLLCRSCWYKPSRRQGTLVFSFLLSPTTAMLS